MQAFSYSRKDGWKETKDPWDDVAEGENLADHLLSKGFRPLATYGDEYEIRLSVHSFQNEGVAPDGYRYLVEFEHGQDHVEAITCASLPDLVGLLNELIPLCKTKTYLPAPNNIVTSPGAEPVVAFSVETFGLVPMVSNPVVEDRHSAPVVSTFSPVRRKHPTE